MIEDILVVDDERDICELVSGILEDEGYSMRMALNSDSALAEISRKCPSLVLLDIWLQGSRIDGIEMLTLLKERYPNLPVVVISGHGNIETAVSAIKLGAYDYIEKPFGSTKLKLIVERAFDASKLRRENIELRRKSGQIELIGNSVKMRKIKSLINKIAVTNSRVMITGASGTGKELAARLLHKYSERTTYPFIIANCSMLTSENMERILFGEVRKSGHIVHGLLEQAHGGCLYLDEVSEIPLDTQSKILRILTEQEFIRVRGEDKIQVNVRIISSTSRNIEECVSEGKVRDDLYHRLNVVPLHMIPLNERRDDIELLIQYFVDYLSRYSGLVSRSFASDAMAVMQSHHWPGNVRQLRNTVEHILILATDSDFNEITADMLPSDILVDTKLDVEKTDQKHIMTLSLREAREIFEREYLLAQIDRFGDNISKTAKFIGMERSALHRKMKMLGLTSIKKIDSM